MLKVILGVLIASVLAFFACSHSTTRVLQQGITIFQDGLLQPTKLSVAVISDLHLSEEESDFEALASLVTEVLNSEADLVLLLGDYTVRHKELTDPPAHRQRVSQALRPLQALPISIVLGNYENWDDRDAWTQALMSAGFTVAENEVARVPTNSNHLCVRKLGDTYTGQFRRTDFPDGCRHFPQITITHDPAAAFKAGIEGLVFAGHTHCGQVSLPLIGPLWAPTEAPREAWCGLYQDELRTLWVSSGVGTSVLPIRLGAPSRWDLIEVIFEATGGDRSSSKIR